MTDIEEKYALFGLTEDKRTQLVQLAQLASLSTVKRHRVAVETVVVHDGNRVVIEKEERSAYRKGVGRVENRFHPVLPHQTVLTGQHRAVR